MRIETGYLGRVEGEAGVSFRIEDGRLTELRINIWEPPRFFEGMLVGRRYDEVPDIVARICGICPVSHMLTSIRAIEKAIGFEPGPETIAARKLMAYSQIASSHLVHLVMLALPDYEGDGKDSLMEVLRLPEMEKRDLLKKFMRVKEALNGITRAFGGRALHPVSMVVGGFTSLPGKKDIDGLLSALESAEGDIEDIAGMMSELKLPRFESASVMVSLSEEGGYAVNSGRIVSGAGLGGLEDEYEQLFEEKETLYSNAKKTAFKNGGQIMTGALARVRLQSRWLVHKARKMAAPLVEGPPNKNTFQNITAQAVELLHFWQECKELLGAAAASLEGGRQRSLRGGPPAREGKGSALTEAPRGLLYHCYEIDRTGTVRKANIVTPTAHNYLAMEQDLSRLIEQSGPMEQNKDMPEEEKRLKTLAGMLIRAYDPCFSCSVH